MLGQNKLECLSPAIISAQYTFFKFSMGHFYPLFLIYFSSIFLHNSILSCYNLLSSCHVAISTPLMISMTMELSCLQSSTLYLRAQKEGVCCQYPLLFQASRPQLIKALFSVLNTSQFGKKLYKFNTVYQQLGPYSQHCIFSVTNAWAY